MSAPSFSTIKLNRSEPLQNQLHATLVAWICSGRLMPGTKLPASRRLADELAVSRNTVTEVFDQLRSEGFLTSHRGKGVFVQHDLPVGIRGVDKVAWSSQGELPVLSDYADRLTEVSGLLKNKTLPFTPGVPDIDAFPIKSWQALLRRHSDRTALMAYGDQQGHAPLRVALADYLRLSRGVECTAEQIIITAGAQQAISLCAQLLLNKGDEVLIESPGYIGARKAFLGREAKLRPIGLKPNGVDVDYLRQNSEALAGARVMYVSPTHQYPMGGILSAAQRLELLDWAVQRNTWLIEDDYDSEFHFTNKPIAALQGMAAQTPVIYMGSFSKTLLPALRLGYLVVPKPLVAQFVQAKTFMTGETPLLIQAVVADFILEGHFIRHIRKMRQHYKEKWLHFEALIKSQLQGLATPIAESAGMHLVLDIENIDDVLLKQQLVEKGFGSSALSSYYIGVKPRTGLVLGFANTTMREREECIAYLQQALKRK